MICQQRQIYLASTKRRNPTLQAYKHKGSLADATKPLTTGQAAGDVYNLEASDYGPAGTNVAWDGKAWDAPGGLFVVDASYQCRN